jgi:hydrogenase nickel incorporation protein HypB
MCGDCGCQQANERLQKVQALAHPDVLKNFHKLAPAIAPLPTPEPEQPRRIELELSVLAKNDRIAAENRRWFAERGTRVLNLISSPGSGKTLLLERTVELLGANAGLAILTGDQEQDFDARRLKAAGADVRQINTRSSCHLDAEMIRKELGEFVKREHRLLVIENVGNLVCPAAFDLGETEKIALLSTTEGEDKPSKYPLLFHEASLILITKIDLMPHLDWNLELCLKHIRQVNPSAPILRLSARTGEGMGAWLDFLRR